MRVMELPAWGIENLRPADAAVGNPGSREVVVRFEAASVNYRDYQIVAGEFAPGQELPIIPLSDGCGAVVEAGAEVTRVQVGDRVTPLFFPRWISGEALGDERSVSSGLEAPGVLREFGVYHEDAVARVADHLTPAEAACFPCAGLTAWNALVRVADVQPGGAVLILGTGGVAIIGLQLAKALGATAIVTSSSEAKLERAREAGADHVINYCATPDWGEAARELTDGRGVDAVIEIGGTATLPQSLRAIRRGGHIAVVGYLAGAGIELTVFDLIMTNANIHGMSVGNRDDYEAMMSFVSRHGIRPVIHRVYEFEASGAALGDIARCEHFGKLALTIAG